GWAVWLFAVLLEWPEPVGFGAFGDGRADGVGVEAVSTRLSARKWLGWSQTHRTPFRALLRPLRAALWAAGRHAACSLCSSGVWIGWAPSCPPATALATAWARSAAPSRR